MKRLLMKWLTGMVGLTAMIGAAALATAILHQTDDDWIDAITNAVLIERRGGGGHPGVRWEPYVEQLQVARTHFERGDVEATYRAMNRFMDMLEARRTECRQRQRTGSLTFAASWCLASTTMSRGTSRNSSETSSENPVVCSGSSF